MPDEAVETTPVEGVETPEATPDGAPADAQPAVDWEKRYNDQRSEFDRRGSELNNIRFTEEAIQGKHGPEQQMAALQRLGVDVEQQAEVDDPFDDPYENRLGKLEQELASRSEQEQQARFEKLEKDYIDSTLGELESDEDIKLTDKEKRFVKSDALNNRLEDGRPDLQSAFAEVVAYRKETLAGHVASKKAPKAPVGTAGSKDIDPLKNPEAYKQQMVEEFQANKAAAGES